MMKAKNRPKRAWKNTGHAVGSAGIRYKMVPWWAIQKKRWVTVRFSRRTVLCSVGPSVEMLVEEKPLWLIHQYRISISLLGDVPVWPSYCCDCLHCGTVLPAAVFYRCASKLNKLNCQQRSVTSVLTKWTASSRVVPVC
jgi:hypothetical protein